MSKSRGNFLDPHDVVARVRRRRRPLRDAARGRLRPRHRGLLGLVRPPLQRGPRQRLRQPRQPHASRWSTATWAASGPAPRARASRRWPRAGRTRCGGTREKLDGYLLHDALAELWEFVGGANKIVDAEQPWTLAKPAKAGDEAAAARLRGGPRRPRRGLPARRPRGGAVHARRWRRGSSSSSGTACPYGPDGNGGPAIARAARAGAPHAAEAGRHRDRRRRCSRASRPRREAGRAIGVEPAPSPCASSTPTAHLQRATASTTTSDAGPGRRAGWRRASGSWSRAGTCAPSSARSALVAALGLARRRRGHPPPRRREGGRGRLGADRGLGARRARRGDRRDRARLGPHVLAAGTRSWRTCAGTSRSRSRPASRRSSTAGRRRGSGTPRTRWWPSCGRRGSMARRPGRLRRPPAGRRAQLLGAGGLRARRCWRWASRSRSAGLVFRRGRGGVGRRRAARAGRAAAGRDGRAVPLAAGRPARPQRAGVRGDHGPLGRRASRGGGARSWATASWPPTTRRSRGPAPLIGRADDQTGRWLVARGGRLWRRASSRTH